MAEYRKDRNYYLMPGPVKSKSDGDIHHISARELARLYGVPLNAPNVTVIKPEERDYARIWEPDKDIFLHPDYHGDYELPD